jgi:hypothetical protein
VGGLHREAQASERRDTYPEGGKVKWIPITDAAKKQGITLDDLIERIILDNAFLDLPCAIKCDQWPVVRYVGHRAALMAKEEGSPAIRLPHPREMESIVISGFYRLYRFDLLNLAHAWPKPIARSRIYLWTDKHKWATPEDLLRPCDHIDPQTIRADDVRIDAEYMGWVGDKINTQSKEKMLEIIGALAMAAGLNIHKPHPIDPAARRLEEWTKQAGAPIGVRTLTSYLKDASERVRPLDLQTQR